MVRGFLLGLLVGLAAMGVVAWSMRSESAPSRTSGSPGPPPPPPLPAPQGNDPPPTSPSPAHDADVVTLRIGGSFRFGGGAHAREEADLFCLDLRHEALLECRNGCALADVAVGAVGLPTVPAEVAKLVTDAPTDLRESQLTLPVRATERNPGVAFVRAASGVTYRMHVEELVASDFALDRAVRLRFAAVPARDGGGLVRLPTAVADARPTITRAEVRRILGIGRAIPGDSFAKFLDGEFSRLAAPAEPLAIERDAHLVVDGPIASRLVLSRRGAILAPDGIAPAGVVRLEGYAGLSVAGTMQGRVETTSYAFLHFARDLAGEVETRSYATIVIEGDLLGRLTLGSYTTLLLRGRVLGTLDAANAGWCDFWFQHYFSKAEAERFGPEFRSVRLHLRATDLPEGKHKNVGGWREVVVGEPAWAKLAP